MGQLQGKRDTFWDTAPMYDGRREIWDALKAAVEAAEQEDYDLAQAILDGANITLPTGSLLQVMSGVGLLSSPGVWVNVKEDLEDLSGVWLGIEIPSPILTAYSSFVCNRE